MEVNTEEITFVSGGDTLQGYVARPEGEGPFPGIVVIHEIFGLNDNIRDVARRLAGESYAALAVDLLSQRNRAVCMFNFFTGLLLNSLNNSSIRDLKAALTYLSERAEVDPARLGAIGFCMGGSFAIAWSCADDRLKVIAPFYGMNPRPLESVARACPVVGSYPKADFTAKQGRKLARELRRDGIPHDIKIYPGAKHSFFNDQGPTHDPAASQDAWERTLAYFDKRLR